MVSETKVVRKVLQFQSSVCACNVCACVGHNFSLVDGFQNNLAQLFFLRSSSAFWNICLGRLKVKVTHEGQMIKWS